MTRELSLKMIMHTVHILDSEITAAHPGLIGYHDQLVARLLQSPERFNRSRQKNDFLRFVKILALFDNRSVAVKENSSMHPGSVASGVSRITSFRRGILIRAYARI